MILQGKNLYKEILLRWHQLQEETKRELITFGTMEIPLIRSGSRSLSGIPPNRVQFEGTGLRNWVIEHMFALIDDFSMKLQPDSYETALIAALAATSPDRGISSAVDYKILSNIQVQCSLVTLSYDDKRSYLKWASNVTQNH